MRYVLTVEVPDDLPKEKVEKLAADGFVLWLANRWHAAHPRERMPRETYLDMKRQVSVRVG